MVLLGGMSFLLAFRRVAGILLIPPIVHWLVLPVLQPLSNELPMWITLASYAIFAILMLQAILGAIFGAEVAAQTVGQLLASGISQMVRAIWLLPVSLQRVAVRLVHVLPRAGTGDCGPMDHNLSQEATGSELSSAAAARGSPGIRRPETALATEATTSEPTGKLGQHAIDDQCAGVEKKQVDGGDAS